MAERYPAEFVPPPRLLMGAGPTNVDPRVLRALAGSMLTQVDAEFVELLADVRAMLRLVFLTENEVTWPLSGSGTAGMEAALINVLEPGEKLLACANGVFVRRAAEIARVLGIEVVEVAREPGLAVDPDAVRDELRRHDRVKAVIVCHGETSTGVLTPLPDLALAAHEAGALLIADAVTTLGGAELRVDEWGIDVCFSCTQKCLACPPGLAPITFSERAMAAVESRKTPVPSFYLSMQRIGSYFGQGAYHHTPPVSMLYGLHEGLRIILEEGLDARWARHDRNATALCAGLEAMGLELFADPQHRLASLTTVKVPDGVDGPAVRRVMVERYGVVTVGGLGDLAAVLWRVGLMGFNSTPDSVLTFLAALEDALLVQGFEAPAGAGPAAARGSLGI